MVIHLLETSLSESNFSELDYFGLDYFFSNVTALRPMM